MQRIDDLLIEHLFSPLAGFLEQGLGIGRWRAAIECLNGHLACYVAAVALTIAHKGEGDAIFAELLGALAWLAIMEGVRRAALRQAGSSLGVQTARMREKPFRALFLLMLPLSLVYADGLASAFYSASLALLVAHLYLKASEPPPPRRRASPAFGRA
jgi:hypothetical protein